MDKKIFIKICESVADGVGVVNTCKKMEGVTYKAFFKAMCKDEKWRNMYLDAKSIALERMAEEITDIADEDIPADQYRGSAVSHQRMRIDSRKWLLSKLKPRNYGDKVDITTDGKPMVSKIERIIVDAVSKPSTDIDFL